MTSVAWSPDGRRVETGLDYNTARIWDATTGTVARTPVAAGRRSDSSSNNSWADSDLQPTPSNDLLTDFDA